MYPEFRQRRADRFPAACSICNDVDQLETFLPRRIGETPVERDQLKRRRTALGCNESRRKLQGIGRAQG